MSDNQPPDNIAAKKDQSGANIEPTEMSQLLMLAGWLTEDSLASANSFAEQMRVPLDKILGMQGYLGESAMHDALEILKLLQTKELSFKESLEAMNFIRNDRLSLKASVKKCQQSPAQREPVGEMLRQIGAISVKQLEKALSTRDDTKLPTGWILLNTEIINAPLLNSTISVLRLVESNALSWEQAVNFLKMSRLQQKNLYTILSDNGISTKNIEMEMTCLRLLAESGLVAELHLMAARELSLYRQESLDRTLLANGHIDDDIKLLIDQAIQQLVARTKDPKSILSSLREAGQSKTNHKNRNSQMATIDFIKITKLLPPKELLMEAESARQAGEPIEKRLIEKKLLDQTMLDQMSQLLKLMNHGLIVQDQAVILMRYLNDNSSNLESALNQFKWHSFPVRP